MNNLALNKLPLETDIWKNAEQATNGNFLKYTGSSGFAFSYWPCSYTIDLESEKRISVVRFLLWDGLSGVNKIPDKRKYTFTLSISSDGKNFFTIFSNQNQEGANGWFSFNFLNETYARYIKLTGHFNSSNKEFHIVEFEIYDDKPIEIKSINKHIYDIVTGIPSEQKISDLIDKAISNKGQVLEGIEEKVKSLDNSLLKSNEAFNQINLISKSIDFERESINNQKRAKIWLISAASTFAIFIGLLIWFVFFDNKSTSIIDQASENPNLKSYTLMLLSAYYATKAILLSTILFVLSWFLKNYRSEKHNYTINKHKSMSLTVAISILTKEEFNNVNKSNIFSEAMNIVFSHQISGFSKDEAAAPNIFSSFLPKGISKGDII